MTTRRRTPWDPFHYAAHEVVLGVPQSGKTHLVRRLTRRVRRAVFFDVTGHDYTGEGERVTVRDLVADPDLLAGTFCRLVVVAGDDVATEFVVLVRACRAAAPHGGLVLVADEVGDYSAKCADTLTRLHRNGHHAGVASVLVSQCAVDIPKTCRRTATRVSSLLQTNADDLDALSEPPFGPDYAERVRLWKPGDPPAVWTLPTLYPHAHKE